MTSGGCPASLDLSVDPSDSGLGRQEMDWPWGSGTPTSDTPRAALNYSVFVLCIKGNFVWEKDSMAQKEEKLETTHMKVTFQQKHVSDMGMAPTPASRGLPVPTTLGWPDLDPLTFPFRCPLRNHSPASPPHSSFSFRGQCPC